MRSHALLAVFRRNFYAYFANPTAYVFIVIFVMATAIMGFSVGDFFARNIADLSQLNYWMPWLLMLFIPAVTMASWAQERQSGTEEVLLTLPLKDLEIVAGKYLAALAVFSVALLFGLSNAFVLAWLGNPDWGLIVSSYLGWWLMGAALIPLGLIASSLTGNVTVAAILGVVLCVAGLQFGNVVQYALGDTYRGAALLTHFETLTNGVLSLPGLVYFILLAAFGLYVNLVMVGKRHWIGGRDGRDMGIHYLARSASLAVSVACLGIIAGRVFGGWRADMTVENINSLSPATHELVRNLPGDDLVRVYAYVNNEVPESMIRTKETLRRYLDQMDAVGGSRIDMRFIETDTISEEADEAEERFGIVPQQVFVDDQGYMHQEPVLMGVAFTAGPRQEVIPFLQQGLSVEYELVRSLRAVTQSARTKIGILKNDVELMGGWDYQTFKRKPTWQIVSELQKQYEVVEAMPNQAIDEDIDVLLAVLPSTLKQEEMDNLEDYLLSGRPALIFVDPIPAAMPQLAPFMPPPRPGGPMGRQQQPEPKGDIEALLRAVGISWQKDMVAWDLYNGLPSQPNMPPEVVFISEAAGGAAPFNQESVITSELDRLVAIFPGHVTPTADTTYTFTELLRTGAQSGTVEAQECLQNMPFFGPRLTGSPGPHVPDRPELALAAQVTGQIPANDAPAEDEAASEEEDADAETKTSEAKNLNLILVADADIISDGFFQMRAQGEREFHFDNVNFVLNCVDKLAGDAALIEVRNRKPKYRSLTRFEERKAKFDEERAKALERYKEQAEEKLEEAQERFEEQVAAIEERTDLDARTRTILTEQIRKDAQKALDQEKEAIEAERKRNENKAERDYKRSVKRIGNDFKLLSVILPVLPPLLLGIGVWVFQSRRERRSTPLSRSMRRER